MTSSEATVPSTQFSADEIEKIAREERLRSGCRANVPRRVSGEYPQVPGSTLAKLTSRKPEPVDRSNQA